MERQGRRDTAPELAVRRAAHSLGLRFFVDRSPIPGMRSRADLVFPRAWVAVFVDGCFWHGCPAHVTAPKNNAAWWRAKLRANTERDRRVDGTLAAADWLSIRFWEHDDAADAAATLYEVVGSRRLGQKSAVSTQRR